MILNSCLDNVHHVSWKMIGQHLKSSSPCSLKFASEACKTLQLLFQELLFDHNPTSLSKYKELKLIAPKHITKEMSLGHSLNLMCEIFTSSEYTSYSFESKTVYRWRLHPDLVHFVKYGFQILVDKVKNLKPNQVELSGYEHSLHDHLKILVVQLLQRSPLEGFFTLDQIGDEKFLSESEEIEQFLVPLSCCFGFLSGYEAVTTKVLQKIGSTKYGYISVYQGFISLGMPHLLYSLQSQVHKNIGEKISKDLLISLLQEYQKTKNILGLLNMLKIPLVPWHSSGIENNEIAVKWQEVFKSQVTTREGLNFFKSWMKKTYSDEGFLSFLNFVLKDIKLDAEIIFEIFTDSPIELQMLLKSVVNLKRYDFFSVLENKFTDKVINNKNQEIKLVDKDRVMAVLGSSIDFDFKIALINDFKMRIKTNSIFIECVEQVFADKIKEYFDASGALEAMKVLEKAPLEVVPFLKGIIESKMNQEIEEKQRIIQENAREFEKKTTSSVDSEEEEYIDLYAYSSEEEDCEEGNEEDYEDEC